ncbi:MAG: GNAT family N-acetyltransferase [Propionibacteriaceae bacterium]|jgi:ribosomal-protein-alanine N-acetyltransferase|nr:GNAT family N-acetyltransferase [Propionibacteriaceae bacterium]
MESVRAKGWPARLERPPVTLRPLRRGDEGEWSRIRNAQPDWFRMWDSTSPRTSGEQPISFGQLVTRLNRRARQGQVLPWAVDYSEVGARPRFVGQVTVSGITWGSACWAQIGYWINRDYAGRGIIPTAVAMACDHCFSLGLHRIEIAIRPENTNSLAVVHKLGFRLEGRRERYMHVNGDWRDHDMFVLTAEEVDGRVVDRLPH